MALPLYKSPTNVTIQVVPGNGEGAPNNIGTFVVMAPAPSGPTDLQRLAQNHTESKHLPEPPDYVKG